MHKLIATLAAGTAAAGLTATAAAADAPDRTTIVDVVVAVSGASGFDTTDDFDILREAVVATDNLELLDGNRQLTVFAPTDSAFIALADALSPDSITTESAAFGVIAGLGLDTVDDVLRYHIAPGQRLSGTVVPAERIRTLSGFLTKEAGSTTFDQGVPTPASIVTTSPGETFDIEVDNGVIHVVDAVLVP